MTTASRGEQQLIGTLILSYPQGFQCLVEDMSGFGQFTHDLLQLMGDDYPRNPIMLYALRMPQLSVEHPL